jgi:lysophospholipase L1-like esterase
MIYQNVELHNVDEAVRIPGREGVLLQRIPEEVRAQLREATQQQYVNAACCEIRFVSDWKPVKLKLACYSGEAKAHLYFGDFSAGTYTITEQPSTLVLSLPSPAFVAREDFNGSGYAFAPQVWRLLFQGGQIHFIDIEGEDIRPPKREELPKLRYLAYGTSITQGVGASHPALTYVKQTGWRLRADVLNLGASGNAYCEQALADYMANRHDWDIASLCISVNMLNQGVSAKEFESKADYLVNTMAKQQPDKPIVCIGILPSFHDLGYKWPERNPVSTADEYRSILKSIADNPALPNVHYVDGRQLMSSLYGHSHDLLHPGDHGMIEIGEHLADFMKNLIN